MKRANGFTLVEVLLSAALVVVIAFIVHTLYRTVLVVRETQAGPVSRSESLSAVLNATGRDLAGALRVDEERSPLEIHPGDDGFSILRLPVMPPPGPGDGVVGAVPLSVEYRVDAAGGRRLLRITRPLSGPGMRGAFATNELLRGVAVFQVEGLSGAEWRKEWKGAKDAAWPAACRIRLAAEADAAAGQEVVFEIPTALSVSSSIERR